MTDREQPDEPGSGPDPIEPTAVESAEASAAEPAPPASDPTAAAKYKSTGFRWGLLATLILTAAILLLAAQNTQSTKLSFLAWSIETPLVAIILGSAIGAVIIDELVGSVWRRRRNRRLSEKEELKRLRAERTDS